MSDRQSYFVERNSVVDKAVKEAVQWGRSWGDQWYYKLPPKDRELFYGGFQHFVDACDTAYKSALEVGSCFFCGCKIETWHPIVGRPVMRHVKEAL